MRAYEIFLKEIYNREAIAKLLSKVFDIDSKEIVTVSEFTGDEDIGGKKLLCILSNIEGDFKTNVVLYPYTEELCRFGTSQLAGKLFSHSASACLYFKGTENPYLYTIINSEGQHDVLVDDEILELEDKIKVLKVL